MIRLSVKGFLLTILISLAAAAGEVYVASPGRSETASRLSRLSPHDLFRSVRVAPGNPVELTDDFLEQLKRNGFNTIFLSDVENDGADHWRRVAPDRLALWLGMARNHDLAVIASSPFVEPSDGEAGSQQGSKDGLGSSPHGVRATNFVAASATHTFCPRSEQQSGKPFRYVSSDEVLANLRVWQTLNQGEVIAVTPLGDDPFYLGIPAEKQLEWSRLAAQAAPGIPTLGMIGEFALSMDRNDAQRYWAPTAYSYVALIMYPYNLGGLWGHPLNNQASTDPDGDLTRYVHDFVQQQYERFLYELQPSQTVIPVVQTFTYATDEPGMVPRTRDISLETRLIHKEIQTTLGQDDNYAIAYFYLGTRDRSGPSIPPKGIADMPGWADTVMQENALLEQALRLNLTASTPHLRDDP